MNTSHKSSSHEQTQAEELIFSAVEQMLGVKLEKNKKILLGDTYILPDFYSEEDNIVGEIFSHIGKPKTGQNHKIATDILKMLLLQKTSGKRYRKIIAVCDEEELKKLRGQSYLAESIRQFDIEILYIKIDEQTRNMLLKAQQRQKMINA